MHFPRDRTIAVALTIAGSDSGGGAGIQADLKTFASLGVHGLCVVTSVTAQTPRHVRAIEPCSEGIVQKQLEAVLEDFRPTAVKTGMLYSPAIVRTVASFFGRSDRRALIVDPVMISTSGRRLMRPGAEKAFREQLFPRATLLTPNVPEAEMLLDRKILDADDFKAAAHEMYQRFDCAILLKGGHLPRAREAMDIFYDGKHMLSLRAPFVRGIKTHGTGCTYSAAIVAYMARGFPLIESVRKAKRYITRAIARGQRASGYDVLEW
jgi:hydroxymethylpyrimidine/phosphomethylpyrimidine kinase